MKYRKKPVIIEAEQWFMNSHEGVFNDQSELLKRVYRCGSYYYIDTLEGRHKVTDKDWIIRGIKGETYPCKPDVFEMTYEKVEDK